MKKKYTNDNKKDMTHLKLSVLYRLILIVVLLFLSSNRMSAQVTITTPNLAIPVCSGFPSSYAVLGNIVIAETTTAAFSIGTSVTLELTCPTNFQFLAGTGTATVTSGRNLSAASIVVTATTITITYTCNNTSASDTMTISGIQIRAITAVNTGNITRTGGTGIISGLTNGSNLTNTISSAFVAYSSQPNSNTVCTKGSVTFSVTATGATTYQWKKNSGNITNGGIYSGATTSTLTITNPTAAENNASYTVVLNNATCPVTSNAAIITVNATPAAPTSVTPSTGISICTGSSTNLNATSAGNTINWYTGASGGSSIGSSSSGVNFSVAPTSNTTYYAEAQNALGCKSSPRAATALISIATTPVIEFTQGQNDFTYNLNASSCGVIAGGGQNDLDIFSGNSGGSSTFQWQVSYNNNTTWVDGPGPTSTTTQYVLDPIYTIYESVAGTYYFRVLITNNGCTRISNTVVLTVTGNTVLNPGVIGSNQVFCMGTGDPVAFTATAPTGGTGIYTYQWQSAIDNVTFTNITGATTATYDSPLIGQTTYFRRIAISSGCRGISDAVIVLIMGLPTITTAANATSVCFNSSSQTTPLSYSATTGSPTTYSISWNTAPANSFATVTNIALPVSQIAITVPANTAVGTYTGTITAKNANGCISTGTTFTVTVNPIPSTPTISPSSPTTLCAGSSLLLTSSPGSSYLWSTGETTAGITVATAGSYTVTVFNASGCQSAVSSASVIVVEGLPTATAGGSQTICSDGTATVSGATATNGTIAWSENGVGIITSGATTLTPTYTADAGDAGNTIVLTMTVTSNNTCGSQIQTATYTINVSATPSTPTVSTITQPTSCIASTGSVLLTNLASGGTLNPGNISYSGTSYTATGLSSGTYNYSVTNGSCISSSSANVDIISITIPDNSWNGSVWSTGSAPTTGTERIIFNTDYTSSVDLSGCSCQINSGTVIIHSSNVLMLTNEVNVNGGSLTLESGASLIQINNNVVNTGIITIQRTVNIRRTDYVYWSSVVGNFSASAISPETPTNYIWKWNPTIANSNGSQGNWVNGNEIMSLGRGYIVRGPNSYTSTAAAYTANFVGVPNNGLIQPVISRGTITTSNDDNWNLIGNPYPSSIDAIDFLTLNSSKISGNIRMWTHGTEISAQAGNPFYQNFTYNYSPTDYINYNGTGATPPGFLGKIASGQGFFVKMQDSAGTTNTVTFNNSLRNNSYSNTNFYRSNNSSSTANNETEKNRIWLSLVNNTNVATTALIGYINGATYGEDYLYDAMHKEGTAIAIFSMINNTSMIIQGRPTPFDPADLVPLGITIPSDGNYTIAISVADGLFENGTQDIYLEDTLLGTVHNLRSAPYTFSATTGTFTNRFVMRYTNNTSLGLGNLAANDTFAFVSNNQLQVKSSDNIMEVTIYDITGKLIKTYQPTEFKNQFEAEFFFVKGAYIAKIKLESGILISKKLMN